MTSSIETPRATIPAGALRRWSPAAVGALASALALIGATVPSVWYDEAATVTATTRGWDGLWAMTANVDAVHAAYYLLMHVVFEVAGYSPLALRLPSALAVGATAALLVPLGRRIGGHRLGLLAGLVFAVLPRTLWMGAEGRSYAFAALLVTAATLVLLIARDSPRRRWWIGYAALAALSMVVFVYSALVLIAHAAAVLGGPRPALRRFVVAGGAAAASVAPLVLLIVRQRGQISWLPEVDVGFVPAVLVQQWFGGDRFSWPSGPIDVVAASVGWVLTIAGLIVLLRRRDHSGPLLLALVALPTAALLLITAFVLPLYSPRYLTVCLPFVALAMAVGVEALPRGRWPVLGLIAALGLASLGVQRHPEAKEGTAWPEVAAWVSADRADAMATAVVYGHLRFHPRATPEVIATAYPDPFAGLTDVTLERSAVDAGTLWAERAPLAASLDRLDDAQRVYLIGSEVQHDLEDQARLVSRAGFSETERVRIGHVVIVRLDRG
ncbi:glycosyltransferase family 39 protein [Arenivirga flava]|uniref:Mannosyltransferase n=1 Tax=Arenivirga flava TaxID=1930060 RepID=A0AA37UI04_9MICO|nr:glycosyltransferase family 39 protein [Arenivirga flava]GMA29314.1 mannosyltransferase [Arenivirga flava]